MILIINNKGFKIIKMIVIQWLLNKMMNLLFLNNKKKRNGIKKF